MVKGNWGVVNHNSHCLVEFVVVRVKVDCLFPEHELLASSEQFGGIKFLHVSLAVFHKFLWLMFGI